MPDNDGLQILRSDQKPEKRAAAILPDWRAWAQRAGYRQRLTVPTSAGALSITFEVWQHPSAPDKFLLYHPLLPDTSNTEALFIIPDKATLESMLSAARQLAQGAMQMVQARDSVIREQKAQQN
jgi:hypothetical protein